ncbi:hypothetical protein AB0J20_06040 [Micromonospora costi]|uniref:hypothetical protein n=1 Tax=Micromonospora costi TaxID=1530042 RepID=UPI0034099035
MLLAAGALDEDPDPFDDEDDAEDEDEDAEDEDAEDEDDDDPDDESAFAGLLPFDDVSEPFERESVR